MMTALKIIAAALTLATVLVACQSLRNGAGPSPTAKAPDALRIATYNVHYIILQDPDGRWGLAGWEARKGPLDAAFKALDADIVAFQEMESFSRGSQDTNNLARAWLLARNPGWRAAAVGPWRSFPSTQPIFYRTDRLEPLDQGWFFFSDTPDVIYSRTFNGSYPAFASWARFRDRATAAEFRVLNVHTDYSSAENRRKSVALIVERLSPWIAAGETVILAGDLNARAGSALIESLSGAGLRFADVPGSTYHLDRGLNIFGAIDHIAVSDGAAFVAGPFVLRDKFGPVWPTDHYPVAVDLRFR